MLQIGVEGSYGEPALRYKLGEIRWHAHWRRYAFFPGLHTIYEQDCMRTLANFVEKKTEKHRNGWRYSKRSSTWGGPYKRGPLVNA